MRTAMTNLVVLLLAALHGDGVAAEQRKVEQITRGTLQPTSDVCPAVESLLTRFVAAVQADAPPCAWRPLRRIPADSPLRAPDWRPANAAVWTRAYLRTYLSSWLPAHEDADGRSADTIWRESGYEVPFARGPEGVSWLAADFDIDSDGKADPLLRLDMLLCRDSLAHGLRFPKIARLADPDADAAPPPQQLFGVGSVGDDIFAFDGKPYLLEASCLVKRVVPAPPTGEYVRLNDGRLWPRLDPATIHADVLYYVFDAAAGSPGKARSPAAAGLPWCAFVVRERGRDTCPWY